MKYEGPLEEVRFVARRKRFLCDVMRADGTVFTAHLANTGSMRGCMAEDARVRVRDSGNPKRKLRYSVEQICMDGCWIVVNTARANQVVGEALRAGAIDELRGLEPIRTEVVHGDSRLDFALGDGPLAWVEVKSVTLLHAGVLRFPDAVTTRGTKHVRGLLAATQSGTRAVLFFLVPRDGGDRVGLAEDVDPDYARAVRDAVAGGVEVIAYRGRPTELGIEWGERVPVALDA